MNPGSSDPRGLPLLLTVAQLAQHLGWTEKALRHRIDRGQIPGVTRIGRSVYLRRDEVLGFVLEGRGPSSRSR